MLEGEVRAGQPFQREIGSGLEVLLEPLPSGWILRVLPTSGARPPHDYAELATPPYHSVSPLLISTDFSFRAQDAVGWTPRRFRFAAFRPSFDRLKAAYDRYEAKPGPAPGAEQALAALVAGLPEGTFQIVDARLVPGTADQAGTAATLATHFTTTAHTIESSTAGPTPLGRINWLRFRILLQLPAGFMPVTQLKTRLQLCGQQ